MGLYFKQQVAKCLKDQQYWIFEVQNVLYLSAKLFGRIVAPKKILNKPGYILPGLQALERFARVAHANSCVERHRFERKTKIGLHAIGETATQMCHLVIFLLA